MRQVSITQAKANLREILDAAIAGEEIVITRRGEAIARCIGMEAPKKAFDFGGLRAHLARMNPYAGNSVVEMREQERY